MPDPSAQTSSVGALDEQAIRERVRDLTAQMLSTGRLDGEGIREVVRAMGIGSAPAPAIDDTVAVFVGSLFEKDAMKVPEPSCADTTTAPSTSTWPSRSLVPAPGVYTRSVE